MALLGALMVRNADFFVSLEHGRVAARGDGEGA